MESLGADPTRGQLPVEVPVVFTGFQPVPEALLAGVAPATASREKPRTPVDSGIEQIAAILPPESEPDLPSFLAQETGALECLQEKYQSHEKFSTWALGVLVQYRTFLEELKEEGGARAALIQRLRSMTCNRDSWARKSELELIPASADRVRERFRRFQEKFFIGRRLPDIKSTLDEMSEFRKGTQPAAPFALPIDCCDALEVCLTKIDSALSITFQEVRKTVEFCSTVGGYAKEASVESGRRSTPFSRMRSGSRGSMSGRPLSVGGLKTPTLGGQRTPLAVGAEGGRVFTFDVLPKDEDGVNLEVFKRNMDTGLKLKYLEEMVEKYLLKVAAPVANKRGLSIEKDQLKGVLGKLSLSLRAPGVLEGRAADLSYLDKAAVLLANTTWDERACSVTESARVEELDKMLESSTLSDNVGALSELLQTIQKHKMPPGEVVEWGKTVRDLRLALIGIVGRIRETDQEKQKDVLVRLIELARKLEPGFEKEIEGHQGINLDQDRDKAVSGPVAAAQYRAPRVADLGASSQRGIDSEVSSVAGSEDGEELDVFGNSYNIDEDDK